MKMTPSIIPSHGPNTTHLALMGVLGYYVQVYGLSAEDAASHHLIIPMTVRSDWVYGLSTKRATFDIYWLQNIV